MLSAMLLVELLAFVLLVSVSEEELLEVSFCAFFLFFLANCDYY